MECHPARLAADPRKPRVSIQNCLGRWPRITLEQRESDHTKRAQDPAEFLRSPIRRPMRPCSQDILLLSSVGAMSGGKIARRAHARIAQTEIRQGQGI